eukprot:7203637-Pyramimonas_sp.AAC.1
MMIRKARNDDEEEEEVQEDTGEARPETRALSFYHTGRFPLLSEIWGHHPSIMLEICSQKMGPEHKS